MASRAEKIKEVTARIWKDEDFKQKLISDPKGTLAAAGLNFPEGVRLKVYFDTADTINIVVPRNPADSALSDEALNAISGGTGDTCLNTTCQDHCY